MKYINNNTNLCLEFNEMVAVLAQEKGTTLEKSEQYLKKANSVGTNGYGACKDPADNRCVVYIWEQMDRKYKRMVERWLSKRQGCQHEAECECGNPYRYMRSEPMRALVRRDEKATEWLLRYEKPSGEKLPSKKIDQLSMAAGVYNALTHVNADKKGIIKQQLNYKDVTSFHDELLAYCNQLKSAGVLPKQFSTAYRRFLANYKEYATEGYAALVHGNVGNDNPAKLVDDYSKSVLHELLAHPNQYDDTMVAFLYNKWAKENQYEPIGAATVYVRRHEWKVELTAERMGNAAQNELLLRQVKGRGPSAPLYMLECDDYNINYYYQDANGSKHRRYVSYIVADSRQGLVMGKCYRAADAPTVDMVRIAWLDAMYYIRSLTGGQTWYLPHEVKADHWQAATLHPWFAEIGHFIPPAVGNKHRGYIEQLFGSPHFKRCEKMAAHRELNYNGNNVTSAPGVNMEAVKANANRRLSLGEASDAQVETLFFYARNMPNITGRDLEASSREEQWKADWAKLPESRKRSISDEQFLGIFGIKHEPQGRAITITNRGIEPQIGNEQYSYDLPDAVGMMHLIGKKVSVVYDPYDMSRVLITDGEGVRFVAQAAEFHARAVADSTAGSREALNKVLADKKAQVAAIGERKAKRKELLDEHNYLDYEQIRFAGMMPKEQLAKVETKYIKHSSEPAVAEEDSEEEEFDVAKARLRR